MTGFGMTKNLSPLSMDLLGHRRVEGDEPIELVGVEAVELGLAVDGDRHGQVLDAHRPAPPVVLRLEHELLARVVARDRVGTGAGAEGGVESELLAGLVDRRGLTTMPGCGGEDVGEGAPRHAEVKTRVWSSTTSIVLISATIAVKFEAFAGSRKRSSRLDDVGGHRRPVAEGDSIAQGEGPLGLVARSDSSDLAMLGSYSPCRSRSASAFRRWRLAACRPGWTGARRGRGRHRPRRRRSWPIRRPCPRCRCRCRSAPASGGVLLLPVSSLPPLFDEQAVEKGEQRAAVATIESRLLTSAPSVGAGCDRDDIK